jgi:hypothetical protein
MKGGKMKIVITMLMAFMSTLVGAKELTPENKQFVASARSYKQCMKVSSNMIKKAGGKKALRKTKKKIWARCKAEKAEYTYWKKRTDFPNKPHRKVQYLTPDLV